MNLAEPTKSGKSDFKRTYRSKSRLRRYRVGKTGRLFLKKATKPSRLHASSDGQDPESENHAAQVELSKEQRALLWRFGSWTTAVRWDLVADAFCEAQDTAKRRQRRAGLYTSRDRKSSAMWLGLRIYALLVFMTNPRAGLPFVKTRTIQKMLNVGRQAMYEARRWLKKHNVQQDPDSGVWMLGLPSSESELKEEFVLIPEAAIFLLSGLDLVLLACFQYWVDATVTESGDDKRQKLLPIMDDTGYRTFSEIASDLGLGRKATSAALRRLIDLEFMSFTCWGLKLTPADAQETMAEIRGTPYARTLMRNMPGATSEHFARLRGEDVEP